MRRIGKLINDHFEFGFIAYAWFNASILAVLVGRPWLGLIGVVTVLPALLAYVIMIKARV